MKNEQVKVQEFPLGTPGSVLGIHQKNAYAKKPRNQKERIEMKQLNGKNTNTRSHKQLPISKRTTVRGKDLAPNGIKKISSTAKLAKVASRSKLSPLKNNTKRKIFTSEKKDVQHKTSPRKNIRGLGLYQFVETARTLRSQVNDQVA